jgi:serine/threonine-protein kinase
MTAAFERARHTQANFRALRVVGHVREPHEDWSSQAIQLLGRGEYTRAETVAAAEFRESADPRAFLLMAAAIAREGRFYDCLRELESRPELLGAPDRFGRDLRRIALRCYIETRQFDHAARAIDRCLEIDGADPDLLLKQASVLGLQARYAEASTLLLRLNREHPRQPAVLRRLVVVFEQLRDTGKALAFLRSYAQLAPGDPWAAEKLRDYETLGLL